MKHDHETTPDPFEDLRLLIDAMIEETISDDEVKQLNERLRNDEAATAFYVDYMALSADLHRISEETAPPEALEIAFESELSKRYHNRSRFDWNSAVAALLFFGFIGMMFYGAFPSIKKHMPYLAHFEQQPLSVNYATVVQADDARFAGATMVLDQRLDEQGYVIESGQVTLKFDAGTVATIQAPARFSVTGYNNLRLVEGRTIATVPPEAVGYKIETPDATVVDLGTEFGVSVVGGISTEVHVFKGKVHARISDRIAMSERAKPQVSLAAGQAVRLEADARQIVQLKEASQALFSPTPQVATVSEPISVPKPVIAPAEEAPSIYTYFEDFNGSHDLLLSGSRPDEAPAGVTWVADQQTGTDGLFDARYNSYAALPFVPEAGHEYVVSIEVYPTEGLPDAALNAFIFGFVSGAELPTSHKSSLTGWHQINQPRAWMQLTDESLSVSAGPRIENFKVRPQEPSAKRTLKMVLDTRESAWKVSWHIGTGFVGKQVFLENPSDIDHISFGTSQFAGGVKNLKLTVH